MKRWERPQCEVVRPLISVGIPVYNGERFLRRAIDALLGEGLGSDLEIIISDNASSDGTQQICESYASKHDTVHYSREPLNRGAAFNYNRVLAMSRGRYFKWNAHDDFIRPGYFKEVLAELQDHVDAVGVFTNAVYVDDAGHEISDIASTAPGLTKWRGARVEQAGKLLDLLFDDGQVAMAFAMGLYRADKLREIPQLGNYYGADWVIALELVLAGEVRYLSEQLVAFTRHKHSSSFRAIPDAREQQRFFDPSVKSDIRIKFQHRRRFFEIFRSAARADGTLRERALLQLAIIRCCARRARWRVRYALGAC